MNLGNKIRELRKKNGMTQEQLAASLNISPQAVSKWEMSASYPDMTMIPTLASLFGVSLDELFDFDLRSIDGEIEKICLEHKKYFWTNFDKAERILLEGLKNYPASIRLKTELCDLYVNHLDRGDEIVNKTLELAWQITAASQDVFCTCRTKANLIRIYEFLEKVRGEDHYEDIKRIIESLPYMYPYMLQDRMRLSADYIKGEEGLKEAIKLKNIEWQELFIACDGVGRRYYESGDYENALKSFEESVDVIERFMYPDKNGYEAYPIGGTHANHMGTLLKTASCLLRLGRPEKVGERIDKAKRVYFDAYEYIDLGSDYSKEMRQMIEVFTEYYNNNGLSDYAPLDLGDIEKRIAENEI